MSENASPAAHVGRATETTALGQVWRFARWTRAVWAALAEEARKHLPDPIEQMARNIDKVVLKDAEIMRALMRQDEAAKRAWLALPEDQRQQQPPPPMMAPAYKQLADQLTELALDKASLYLGFQSRELNSWIMSPVGASYLFRLLLAAAHPDVTEDVAYEIIEEVGPDEVTRIMETVRGRAKPKGPNAAAPAA